MDKVLKLKQALRRLERSEGRIARNNARKAVRQVLRGILREMDERFPVIPKQKVAQRVTGLTPAQRVAIRKRKLIARGFITLAEAARGLPDVKLADLAAAGIRVHVLSDSRDALYASSVMVPGWTRSVSPGDVGKLKRLKRSQKERAAHLSMVALGGTP